MSQADKFTALSQEKFFDSFYIRWDDFYRPSEPSDFEDLVYVFVDLLRAEAHAIEESEPNATRTINSLKQAADYLSWATDDYCDFIENGGF